MIEVSRVSRKQMKNTMKIKEYQYSFALHLWADGLKLTRDREDIGSHLD